VTGAGAGQDGQGTVGGDRAAVQPFQPVSIGPPLNATHDGTGTVHEHNRLVTDDPAVFAAGLKMPALGDRVQPESLEAEALAVRCKVQVFAAPIEALQEDVARVRDCYLRWIVPDLEIGRVRPANEQVPAGAVEHVDGRGSGRHGVDAAARVNVHSFDVPELVRVGELAKDAINNDLRVEADEGVAVAGPEAAVRSDPDVLKNRWRTAVDVLRRYLLAYRAVRPHPDDRRVAVEVDDDKATLGVRGEVGGVVWRSLPGLGQVKRAQVGAAVVGEGDVLANYVQYGDLAVRRDGDVLRAE
jgi:hypothetical protein